MKNVQELHNYTFKKRMYPNDLPTMCIIMCWDCKRRNLFGKCSSHSLEYRNRSLQNANGSEFVRNTKQELVQEVYNSTGTHLFMKTLLMI